MAFQMQRSERVEGFFSSRFSAHSVRSCLCPKTTLSNIHRRVGSMRAIRNVETLPDLANFGCWFLKNWRELEPVKE